MGKVKIGVAVCALLVAATVGVASAAPATPDEIMQALNERATQHRDTGIIAGIIDNGKVSIYKAGSSGTNRPLDEHTIFEIGSVTKTFTATVLAKLALQHKVRLSDPVQRYLPKFVHMPTMHCEDVVQ